MILELLFALFVLVVGWSYFEKRTHNFPPGPIAFPLLGHLPLLGLNPPKKLWGWRKSYGPIVGIWFGSYRTVVINDAKIIRKAMSLPAFSGRPKLNYSDSLNEGNYRGIIFTDGSHWMEQRKFAIRNLRELITGKRTTEESIQEEVDDFLKHMQENAGKPLQVKHLFNRAALNTLWKGVFGERLDQEDPEALKAIIQITTLTSEANFQGSLSIFLPWLAKIAPKLSGFERITKTFPAVKDFLRKRIENNNKNYVQNSPNNFVDIYTDEIRKTSDPNSSFFANNDVMLYTLFDLFGAGVETTSTALAWICAYLIHNPQIQHKLQEEIDEVVGKERVPELADRPSLPYTEAVIWEVMRISSMIPFAVIHCATEDVEFQGYFIPKDTLVIPNLYGIHHDEAHWIDPENFRPERFIDSNGKLAISKEENLLPFSAGKRACIGEAFAKEQLFLFTTRLFQIFSASAAGKLPSLEPCKGITFSPKPFQMILEKRA